MAVKQSQKVGAILLGAGGIAIAVSQLFLSNGPMKSGASGFGAGLAISGVVSLVVYLASNIRQ